MSIFKNRVFLGFLCIAIAIIIGFIAFPLINNMTSATFEVCVATQDIPMGTQITEEMVKVMEVGKLNLPETVVGKEFSTQIIGTYAKYEYLAGDYFMTSKLEQTLISPEAKVRAMGSGEFALTVGVGSNVYQTYLPNNIISVFARDENGVANVVNELRYVSVICESDSEGVDILTSAQKSRPSTITFILTQAQAQKLLTLVGSGNYTFVMKYNGSDVNIINNYINQQNTILAQMSNPAVAD